MAKASLFYGFHSCKLMYLEYLEWGHCDEDFTKLSTGVCVSSKIDVDSKSHAKEACKEIGGILPEPRSASVRELLPLQMYRNTAQNGLILLIHRSWRV